MRVRSWGTRGSLATSPLFSADELFADNPLVKYDPRGRFYAGYPLAAPDSRRRVGRLCPMDRRGCGISPRKLRLLEDLAHPAEEKPARSTA